MNSGDQIDIWVIEKALGSGGMGSVYRCHNRTATRILAAVKVLDSSLRKSAGAESRFIREAEILFRLDHPGIVKVQNIRTDADPPYIQMEFVEGESLEGRLQRGAVPIEEAIDLMGQIAEAVAYLHGQEIRHRDIKPANLLISKSGRMKLVDFGLALEANVSRQTQTGVTFGTVSYAPPEWVSPENLDPVRWDIYSMGVVFWEIVTGQVAFPVSGQGSARQQAFQVILAKQNHEPLDPGAAFHDDLRSLLREATAARPDERLSDAKAIVERIRKLTRGLAGPRGQTPVPSEAWEQRRKHGDQPISVKTWADATTPAPSSPRVDLLEGTVPIEEPSAITSSQPGSTLLTQEHVHSETLPPTTEPSLTIEEYAPSRRRWPWIVALAALGAGGLVLVGLAAVIVVAVSHFARTPEAPITNVGGAEKPERPPVVVEQPPLAPLEPKVELHVEVKTEPTKVEATTPATKTETKTETKAEPAKVEPTSPVTPSGAGRVVTNKQFASWLSKNDAWLTEAAIANGLARSGYLAGWAGASPPAGTEGVAAVNVSWYAADAYCHNRGGLASVSAEPQMWEMSASQPDIEWRSSDDGGYAWRSSWGMPAKSGSPADANSGTGFRCAK